MRITFLTGKPPVVKFSDGERRALTIVLQTLETYRVRIGDTDEEIRDSKINLKLVAEAIGLKEKTDVA